MRQDSGMESAKFITVAPRTNATETIAVLVRRAVTYLAVDRQAALRCLNDATALLGSDAHSTMAGAPELPTAYKSGGLARWQTRRTLAYIEDNLGSKLGVGDLSGLVSLSKSHFSRAFRQSLARPPMSYVSLRRVERAKVLMATTNEQLTAIALACGFGDQSHMNRAFRRIVGVSPGVWRRTNGNEGLSAGRPFNQIAAANLGDFR